MKKTVLILVIFAFSQGVNSQNDTTLKQFRAVQIQNGKKLILQSNIDEIADITRKLGDNYYSLKKGTFRVADSMAVEINKNRQIIAIIAVYNYSPKYSNDTIYIHEQRKYRKLISKGREFEYTDSNKLIRVTKWSNETTSFELIEITINGKKETYSVIFDTELNYQKYKGAIDIKSNDVSLEMQKRLGLK
jgi:hypothetical protein